MKILYLAAGKALLNTKHNVIYNDYNIQRDIKDDMLNVSLSGYDLIIATPPCNYYSRANYRRDISSYSINTKHLLPTIIKKLEKMDIPIIIENVINKKLMKDILDNTSLFYYELGRHCYFTNRLINFNHIPQEKDNITNKSYSLYGGSRQGGKNVNTVFEYFIENVL